MSAGVLDSLWAGLASFKASSNVPDPASETVIAKSTSHDGETAQTPKAAVAAGSSDIPTFSLTDDTSIAGSSSNATPVLVQPAEDDVQTSQVPQPAPVAKSSSSTLMAPPALPPSARKQASLTVSQSSLRLPSSGPLPDRGPPATSQQRAGSSGSRGKVLLAPGHSPMDWASLTKSTNLSGVPTFQRVTPSQLRAMNGRKDKPIWSSWQGKVYNITPYLLYHPGGEKELMKAAGRDATKLFMDIHPWVNWENMLSACLVGVLVSEDTPLEDID